MLDNATGRSIPVEANWTRFGWVWNEIPSYVVQHGCDKTSVLAAPVTIDKNVPEVHSDAVLVDRARGGDGEAFRSLVEGHQTIVASVVTGMLGRGADADDVGQETFIRFYSALHDFRGESTVETYLRRIAMNLSLNALKRRKRFRLRLLSRDESKVPLGEPPVAPYDPERLERSETVRAAVAELNEKQRAVVVLRLLEGRSTNETAEVLQIPPGTVMSRLARGMAELQKALTPYIREGKDAIR